MLQQELVQVDININLNSSTVKTIKKKLLGSLTLPILLLLFGESPVNGVALSISAILGGNLAQCFLNLKVSILLTFYLKCHDALFVYIYHCTLNFYDKNSNYLTIRFFYLETPSFK